MPIIILCGLTNPCEWRSCSRANEGTNDRRNATDNGRQLWQLGERIDDGQRARCSRARCRRLPLERLTSQMGGCLMSWEDG